MKGFRIAKALEGEKIVFGPVRTPEASSLAVNSEGERGEVTHTQYRTVAVTNQRVIIEEGDACITIPNTDVRAVVVKRLKAPSGAESFNLLHAESKSGLRVRLNVPALRPWRQSQFSEIFPNARIMERRGLVGLLKSLLGA